MGINDTQNIYRRSIHLFTQYKPTNRLLVSAKVIVETITILTSDPSLKDSQCANTIQGE